MTGDPTLLLIEDDPQVMDLLVRHFTPLGIQIRKAENIPQAMEQMRLIPHPNFVVLDLRLPGSTAEQTLHEVKNMKALNPGAVVMAISGMPDENLPALALALGADGFQHKMEIASQRNLFKVVMECLEKFEPKQPPYVRNLRMLEILQNLMTPNV